MREPICRDCGHADCGEELDSEGFHKIQPEDVDVDGYYAEDIRTPECVACGGPLNLIGRLGNVDHFRCRNCGLDVAV